MKGRSAFGWVELVIGILLIVLGICLCPPDLALTAWFSLRDRRCHHGGRGFHAVIRVERYTGFGPVVSLVSGVVSVMAGLMLMVYPGTGVLVLTLLFPIWFIAHCISRLFHLHHLRFLFRGGYTFALVLNIIGLILGLLMLMSPLFTLTTLRCFASAYLILLGIDSVVIAVSRMGRRL